MDIYLACVLDLSQFLSLPLVCLAPSHPQFLAQISPLRGARLSIQTNVRTPCYSLSWDSGFSPPTHTHSRALIIICQLCIICLPGYDLPTQQCACFSEDRDHIHSKSNFEEIGSWPKTCL